MEYSSNVPSKIKTIEFEDLGQKPNFYLTFSDVEVKINKNKLRGSIIFPMRTRNDGDDVLSCVKLLCNQVNISFSINKICSSQFSFMKSQNSDKLLLTTNEFSCIRFIDFVLMKYDEESKDSPQYLTYNEDDPQIMIQAGKLKHIEIHGIFNESNIDSCCEDIRKLLLFSNQVTYHFKYEGSNELNSLTKFLPPRTEYCVSKSTNFHLNNYDIFNNPPDIEKFISICDSVCIKNLTFYSEQDDDYKIVCDLLNLKSIRDNLQEIALFSKYLSNCHEILDLLTKCLQIRKIKIVFRVNEDELESSSVRFMKNRFYKKAGIIESLNIEQETTIKLGVCV